MGRGNIGDPGHRQPQCRGGAHRRVVTGIEPGLGRDLVRDTGPAGTGHGTASPVAGRRAHTRSQYGPPPFRRRPTLPSPARGRVRREASPRDCPLPRKRGRVRVGVAPARSRPAGPPASPMPRTSSASWSSVDGGAPLRILRALPSSTGGASSRSHSRASIIRSKHTRLRPNCRIASDSGSTTSCRRGGAPA